MYPRKEHVAFQGKENLAHYKMGRGFSDKGFCKICAVPIDNWTVKISDAEREALPEAARSWYDGGQVFCGLNTQVLDEVDLAKLKPVRHDGWKDIMPLYENP